MSRREPISIESLLEKQRSEQLAASKVHCIVLLRPATYIFNPQPRFLSKEERAKLAIAKRAQEIKDQRERDENVRRDRETLEKEAQDLRRETWDDRDSRRSQPDANSSRYDSKRPTSKRESNQRPRDPPALPKGGFENVPTGPRKDREKGGSMAPPPPPSDSLVAPPPPPSSGPESVPENNGMTSSEMDAIRSQYLGVDKKKRKMRKLNNKKFIFDWDIQDDTANDSSASSILGAGRQGAQTMFGRGHLAGLDDGPSSGPRKGSAANPHLADAMERRKALKAGIDERHWTEKPLHEMKERDWRIFREDFSISARGGQIPHPLRSWTESAIPPQILDCISEIGYKEPSPIQRQAIPIGLQNRDIIGIAETGSGKTAAFVIPMLAFISLLPIFTDDNRHLGPYALILAPTRELAQQIEAESRKFAAPLGYRCVSIVGGRAVEEQQFNLREGAEIIIATPGRLKDVIERHVIVLSQCRYVVMDEADRMVHLGFEADLTFILDALPTETMVGEDTSERMEIDEGDGSVSVVKQGRTRVTTLFSATMPPAVERLARKYLKKPAIITIGEAGRAVDTVEQRVEFVQGDEKKKSVSARSHLVHFQTNMITRHKLLEILNSGMYAAPIIVFVNQKKTADMVAKDIQRGGWSTSTLHSGKNQEQREASLQALRTGEAHVLVATDLAGRGIDVQDVSLVINFQMASTIEAYVHRIGMSCAVPETVLG